jgi:para-aminobenzoate synthetase/4-amino-4-deoxychorismate lyase
MQADSRFALFDGDGGSAVLLTDYRRSFYFDASADLAVSFAVIEEAAASGGWVALAVDYALGARFEPALFGSNTGRSLMRAWVFGRSEQLDAKAVDSFLAERLAVLSEHEMTAGVADLSSSLEASNYAVKVEKIRRWIVDGECYQINLTFPLHFRFYGHPLALYANLRARQPVRYGGYIATPEETLLSFSPELFFERAGDRVVTRPMKGTAPRGASLKEDNEARSALLGSAKERAENLMIVDLLRNDLGRLASPGKVRVDSLFDAEAYPTLWQMVSTVSADLPGACLFELFRALFPCGSITGAPKIRAMQHIAEIEDEGRGLYTGALGWLAPSGDCRFNVAIRTLELAKDRSGKLGVGSGVVIDADPASEYAECLLKAKFLTDYNPGFALVETLRLENCEYPLLSRHLERLESSAHALGFVCTIEKLSAALLLAAANGQSGVWRVRLALAHDGNYRIDSLPLPVEADRQWRVLIASEALDPDDYLLRHKTTARGRYDRVLAALAGRPDVFDAIFLNTRGEVCEGARSNVFVERGGVLLTPPLSCGLLPGVMRRQLIESGRAVEQVLRLEDLLAAPALYMANALRGLVAVRLAD